MKGRTEGHTLWHLKLLTEQKLTNVSSVQTDRLNSASTYDLALSSKRDILWSFHGKCWEVLNSPGWGRGRGYRGRSEPLHHNKSGTGKFVNLKIFLCKVCRTFISFLRNYISRRPTHIWKIYFKLSTNYFWTAICFHWHIVLNRISKLYILHISK